MGRAELDVVKGVIQKVIFCFRKPISFFKTVTLRAFEKSLQDYPGLVENVDMVPVTTLVLSDSLKLERMASERACGAHKWRIWEFEFHSCELLVSYLMHLVDETDYSLRPLLFAPSSHQALEKDEFHALLSVADLSVITPLRDRMNTTSIIEFVIAQESTN